MEKNNNSKKKTIIILLVVLVLAGGIGIYRYTQSGKTETTDNAQVDGNIMPFRSSITGYIQKVNFKDNQLVKKGDTLIVFNTTELSAGVSQAEANLLNAQSSISVIQSKVAAKQQEVLAVGQSIQSEEQQILAAKASWEKAERDLSRTKKLAQINAATQEQIEHDETNLKIAKSNYNSLKNQKKSLDVSAKGLSIQSETEHKNIAVRSASVKQKEAELIIAKENFKKAFIIAPFDGIVTKRTIQEGQYVSAGQSLCALINITDVWITANFKEVQLQHIRVGQSVDIHIDAYPELKLSGLIESFGGATGAKFSLVPPDNATGNFIKITQRYPVRIRIENLAKKQSPLSPGLSAFVSVKIK